MREGQDSGQLMIWRRATKAKWCTLKCQREEGVIWRGLRKKGRERGVQVCREMLTTEKMCRSCDLMEPGKRMYVSRRELKGKGKGRNVEMPRTSIRICCSRQLRGTCNTQSVAQVSVHHPSLPPTIHSSIHPSIKSSIHPSMAPFSSSPAFSQRWICASSFPDSIHSFFFISLAFCNRIVIRLAPSQTICILR